MLGKIEGRRRGQQRMRRLDGITNSMDMSLSKLQKAGKDREGKPGTLQSMGFARQEYWSGLPLPITNLDSVLKGRDITLPTKAHIVKVVVFPVVMYGCESWTVKRAERPRIDAFELWCWRRLLRVLGQQGDQTSQS